MTIIFSSSSSSSSSGKNSSSSRLLNNPFCCCCIGHSQLVELPHQLATYEAIPAFNTNNNNPNCSHPPLSSKDCSTGPYNNNNGDGGRLSRWKKFLWKLRAQFRKIHICRSCPEQELHYDAFSYAKNFDDGTWINTAAFPPHFSIPLKAANQG